MEEAAGTRKEIAAETVARDVDAAKASVVVIVADHLKAAAMVDKARLAATTMAHLVRCAKSATRLAMSRSAATSGTTTPTTTTSRPPTMLLLGTPSSQTGTWTPGQLITSQVI